jgi:hypothetical protein
MKKKIKIGYEDIAINVINFTTNDKKDDNVLGEYDSSNAKIRHTRKTKTQDQKLTPYCTKSSTQSFTRQDLIPKVTCLQKKKMRS